MIKRLYVHNFRCLENFELNLEDLPSALLVGKNGVGKSSVRDILRILQAIGRGESRMEGLEKLGILNKNCFTRLQTHIPLRIDINVVINKIDYRYKIAFDFPENFKEIRIVDEAFYKDGSVIFSRELAQVNLVSEARQNEVQFLLDWHTLALPIIQATSDNDSVLIFRNWLSRMILLSPIPCFIKGTSQGEHLTPDLHALDFGKWLTGLLSQYPAAYSQIKEYLQEVMPEFDDIENQVVGKDAKSLFVRYKNQDSKERFALSFSDLSDGEKCYFICALVLVANDKYGPLFCFWDEPDNHLNASEIGHFALSLRKSFLTKGQILLSSHNLEVIRKFPPEATFILDRQSHLEPTIIKKLRTLNNFENSEKFMDGWVRGDVSL